MHFVKKVVTDKRDNFYKKLSISVITTDKNEQ